MFKNDITYAIFVGMFDTVIYNMISVLYNIFVVLCKIDLFNNSTAAANRIYTSFTSRIYTIISLAMLFFFAYELIMLIINPDRDTKATTGLIKDTVISVVLIAIGPILFNYMAIIQSHIIDENTVFTVVLGKSGAGAKTKNPGDELAMMLLMSFLHPVNMDYSTFVSDGNITLGECANMSSNHICHVFYERLLTWSNVKGGVGHLTEVSSAIKKEATKSDNNSQVEWIPIGDVVGGLAVVWFMLGYIFDVTVRAVKLGILELTSPIFFIMRIFPATKKNFTTWFNEIKKTYLELFAKIAILAFTIELATMVPDILKVLWDSTGNTSSGMGRAIATFCLVLGLFIFAKQLPDLFKKMISSGMFEGVNFKPGLKSRPEGQKIVGAGVGMAVGAPSGLGKSIWNYYKDPDGKNKDIFKGIGRGVINGAKQGYKTDGLGFFGKNLMKNAVVHSTDMLDNPIAKMMSEKERKKRSSANSLNDDFMKIFDAATDKSWGDAKKMEAETAKKNLMQYLSEKNPRYWKKEFATSFGNIKLKNDDGSVRTQNEILSDLKAVTDGAKYQAQVDRIMKTGTAEQVSSSIRKMMSSSDFQHFINSDAGKEFRGKEEFKALEKFASGDYYKKKADGSFDLDANNKKQISLDSDIAKGIDSMSKAFGAYNQSAKVSDLQKEMAAGPKKPDGGGK